MCSTASRAAFGRRQAARGLASLARARRPRRQGGPGRTPLYSRRRSRRPTELQAAGRRTRRHQPRGRCPGRRDSVGRTPVTERESTLLGAVDGDQPEPRRPGWKPPSRPCPLPRVRSAETSAQTAEWSVRLLGGDSVGERTRNGADSGTPVRGPRSSESAVCNRNPASHDRPGPIAMQKVEGSSPFIRSLEKAPETRGFSRSWGEALRVACRRRTSSADHVARK
jgi:hypothetical protein